MLNLEKKNYQISEKKDFFHDKPNISYDFLKKLELSIQYTNTSDNVNLALARYKNKNAQPVILMHGVSQNFKVWDFPLKRYNFAQYLYNSGYDVWLPCLRGHGSTFIKSSDIKGVENIDDLAIYDIPAIVDKVVKETGISPIWIGHSLGGMLAYMYLQGINYKDGDVTSNINLSKERNKKLKALITIGSPTKLQWDKRTIKKTHQARCKTNRIFPFLVHFQSLRSFCLKLPYIPTASLFNHLLDKGKKSSIFIKAAQVSLSRFLNSSFASLFWYPQNVNKTLIKHLLCTTLNDISPGVLEQFADWVEHKTFRSKQRKDGSYLNYCDNFDRITLPLCVLTGDKDKIASAPIVYQEGFLKMGSNNKQYNCFPNFGHNDLCVGLKSSSVVFPFIRNILQKYYTSEVSKNKTLIRS
mgnify:CR=1 FL=1